MVTVPPRNSLAIISHGDLRAVKFFEDIADTINANGVGSTRPDPASLGQQHYDTALGIPIWFNGTIWTDALGVAV